MRVKSPEEMVKALENCAKMGPCTNCPYDEVPACVHELSRDAAETIRLLLIDLAMETEAEV
mgnify:CR=1 FL=1